MDPQITALLKNDLAGLLLPLLLGLRAVRKKFALSQNLPTIREGILVGAMFALGLGLAYANVALHPTEPVTVVDLAWVQGIIFGIALLLMDLGVDATSIQTAGAQQKLGTLSGAAGVLILCGSLAGVLFAARPAAAEPPPALSIERLSAGPRVVAQLYDFDSNAPREFGWAAGAAASYSLTSRWDLKADAERKFNAGALVPPHWRLSAGATVKLPISSERQGWYLGVERAWYKVQDAPFDAGGWVVRLQWAWGGQDQTGRDYAFAIARGRYDVDRGRRDLGVGVQPQLLGGH